MFSVVRFILPGATALRRSIAVGFVSGPVALPGYLERE